MKRWEPWTFLALQGVLLAAAIAVVRRVKEEGVEVAAQGGDAAELAVRRLERPVLLALRISILVMVVLSGARQWITPISGRDERTYQASRVGYWLHHQSVLWFETHNERQVAFPYGGELFFGWPVLFTRSELVGKMVFWLGFPISVILVGLVCRSMGLSRRAAQVGALLFAITPATLQLGTSLKSDLWSPVFLLCGLGLLLGGLPRRPRGQAPPGCDWRIAAAGIAAALAVNVKTTLAAAVPGMGLLAVATLRPRRAAKRTGLFVGGLVLGTFASGLGPTLIDNWRHQGHPLGSPRMLEVHRSELSQDVAMVHAARVPLVLAELPEVPSEALRAHLENRGRELSARWGADTLLPLEHNVGWPGIFTYHLRSSATRYGLGGLLWLPVLAAAGMILVVELARYGAVRSPAALMLLSAGPLFAGIVLLVRWMGGGPERFWLAPYALMVPMAVALLAGPCRRWSWLGALSIVLVGWAASASMRAEVGRLDWVIRNPPKPAQIAEPWAAATPLLPAGAKILMVAGQNTRDYTLFAPEKRFSNRVISWGTGRYDRERLESMLERHRPTHVILERPDVIGFFHDGMRTEPVVKHMEGRPDYRRVPLNDAVVLFERVQGEPMEGPTEDQP